MTTKNKTIRTIWQRGMAFILAITMMFTSVVPSKAESTNYIVLKAGTPVMLELLTNVTSNNSHPGDVVDFRVTNDVKVKGETVICAGSIAKGQVTYASKSNVVGTPGEISITVRSVTAVDGTIIPLSSSGTNNEGNDKLVVSIVVSIFCFLGLLIKGKKGEITAGTPIYATVASNVEICIN